MQCLVHKNGVRYKRCIPFLHIHILCISYLVSKVLDSAIETSDKFKIFRSANIQTGIRKSGQHQGSKDYQMNKRYGSNI